MKATTATSHYDRDYYDTVLGEMLADEDYYRVKSRCAAKTYFRSFQRPLGKVLEFGCGIGNNIADIPEAVGYDSSSVARQRCRQHGVQVISSEAEIPRRRFDYVLCRHVLEHTESPLDVLRGLFDYLDDHGVLILVLPYESHRRVPLEPDVNRHLFCWNFRSINNLVSQAGGRAVHNRYEPMFGFRTHRILLPLLRIGGFPTYYTAARLAGRAMQQWELVIHARRERRNDDRD